MAGRTAGETPNCFNVYHCRTTWTGRDNKGPVRAKCKRAGPINFDPCRPLRAMVRLALGLVDELTANLSKNENGLLLGPYLWRFLSYGEVTMIRSLKTQTFSRVWMIHCKLIKFPTIYNHNANKTYLTTNLFTFHNYVIFSSRWPIELWVKTIVNK